MDIDAFNAKWQRRYQAYIAACPQPVWTPDLALTPELRYQYERFLPIDEFTRSLVSLLLDAVLPHVSWIPECLRRPHFRTIADLWQRLPRTLAGRVQFSVGELLPLACALAAPDHFGTANTRYPEQHRFLQQWLTDSISAGQTIYALDYGCGTGQGTRELSRIIAVHAAVRVVGVTSQPLEAWMATHQRLPHRPDNPYPLIAGPAPHFVVGDVCHFASRQSADLVVCNGLIGGPFVNTDDAWPSLWYTLAGRRHQPGLLLVSDRFHDGHRKAVTRFVQARPESVKLVWADNGNYAFELGIDA